MAKPSVQLKIHVDKVVASIKDESAQRVWAATQVVKAKTIETLSGERSGREYRVPGTDPPVFYTASAPGEPPAARTGNLRQRIADDVIQKGDEVIGRVGTPLDYGRELEVGRRDMAPRPWLRPSFERSEPEVKDILTRRWW